MMPRDATPTGSLRYTTFRTLVPLGGLTVIVAGALLVGVLSGERPCQAHDPHQSPGSEAILWHDTCFVSLR